MVYVFDTSAFIVLGHYFPGRFPSFWLHLNALVDGRRLLSVSEVLKELDNHLTRVHLADWVKSRPGLFVPPSTDEMAFVSKIFSVPSFQALVKEKDRLRGAPVADPFVIARAAVAGGCVVTEEQEREGAVRIPTVCQHFAVDCLDIEGLMAREGWSY
jgi:hypothetical protein